VRGLVVASVTTCLAFAVGCGAKSAIGRTNLATNLGGNQEVKASVDGGGFISSDGKTAVITFAGGKLAVEKGAVKLDGEVLAKLPEDARKVEVDYTAGKLTVTADGKSVASRELRK
jgi:ABC-type molybdate transport system ATPase subunit